MANGKGDMKVEDAVGSEKEEDWEQWQCLNLASCWNYTSKRSRTHPSGHCGMAKRAKTLEDQQKALTKKQEELAEAKQRARAKRIQADHFVTFMQTGDTNSVTLPVTRSAGRSC